MLFLSHEAFRVNTVAFSNPPGPALTPLLISISLTYSGTRHCHAPPLTPSCLETVAVPLTYTALPCGRPVAPLSLSLSAAECNGDVVTTLPWRVYTDCWFMRPRACHVPPHRLSAKHNPPVELAVAHVWGECLPSAHQSDWSQATRSRWFLTAEERALNHPGGGLNGAALSRAPLRLLTFTPERLSGGYPGEITTNCPTFNSTVKADRPLTASNTTSNSAGGRLLPAKTSNKEFIKKQNHLIRFSFRLVCFSCVSNILIAFISNRYTWTLSPPAPAVNEAVKHEFVFDYFHINDFVK